MDTPTFDFVVNTRTEIVTRRYLLARFYKRNRFLTEKWGSKKRIVTVSIPLAVVEDSSIDHDQWLCFYREGYVVCIEQGRQPMLGPHVAKLYFNPPNKERIWLGTMQIAGAFYNLKSIYEQLREAIESKDFFCTETAREEEFDISEDEREVFADQAAHRDTKITWSGRKLRIIKANPIRCPICAKRKAARFLLRKHAIKKHGIYLCYKYPTNYGHGARI